MCPDFLCIGAQKAGTTWLRDNLRPHPQIWVPPVTEMHYFLHPTTRLRERLFGNADYLVYARRHLLRQLAALPRSGDFDGVGWAARYCLLPRSNDWYRSLFPRTEGRLIGEVCPSYARLPPEAVRRVHDLMPNARIIYLLRNPIEWTWSNAAKHFGKTRAGVIDRVPDETLLEFFGRKKSLRHVDYLGNLANWEHYFGADRILVSFFDELLQDPRGFLKRILSALGVDSSDAVMSVNVGERRNPGKHEGIPPRLLPRLTSMHLEQIRSLQAKFDNQYTRSWLELAERAMV